MIARALLPLACHAVFLGGGPASFLRRRFLQQRAEAGPAPLAWHPRPSRKLEFDPAVMNRERLEVLAAHRFDRLSFGIETLDPEVNARHNRGRQNIATIERSFTELRAVGINDVACDFVL